jgi:hypothetical protein
MLLMQAQNASIRWENQKKRWTVTIRIGGEAIRRFLDHSFSHDAEDDALRNMVISTARDDGYELGPESVGIER